MTSKKNIFIEKLSNEVKNQSGTLRIAAEDLENEKFN